ncbi:MAG: MFS transporter [Alphaproteobacteria bacterium]|nr:MFS transporter [Alphaproteobacteria bacterium]
MTVANPPLRSGWRRWLAASAVYRERAVLVVLALGFASGLPLALSGATLAIRLREAGLELGSIGLFAAVGAPYTLKVLWAPLVDHLPIPVLTRVLGRRRGWLLASQVAVVGAILALGGVDPEGAIGLVALLAFILAALSATQDIVIDAYRVESLEDRQQGAGAAMAVFGYRVGMLASGALALILAERLPWVAVYLAMAALMAVGVFATLLAREPAGAAARAAGVRDRAEAARLAGRLGLANARAAAAWAWLYRAAVRPFLDFMTRSRWLWVLLFVVLYKFGDALAGSLASVFYLDIGFAKDEIGAVAKVFGFGATLVGLALGGWLLNAVGAVRALLIAGILQLLSNLTFAVQAVAGPDLGFLAFTIAAENLAGGMGTAAFVAYLSGLCNVAYTATQYALLSSLAAFARTLLVTPAGFLVERLDWTGAAAAVGLGALPNLPWIGFFLLTTLAAVPGLLLLLVVARPRRD